VAFFKIDGSVICLYHVVCYSSLN